MPIIPYPQLATCLGLTSDEPEIDIMEGYVRAQFDFDVSNATESCIFEVLDDMGSLGALLKGSGSRQADRETKFPSFNKATKKMGKAGKLLRNIKQKADESGLADKAKEQVMKAFIQGDFFQ